MRSGLGLAIAMAAFLLLPSAAGAYKLTAPNSHDFGPQAIGTTSLPFTFTLKVTCYPDVADPMGIACNANDPFTPNVTVTGPFAIRDNNCTSMMPGNTTFGTTCSFGVVFVPNALGAQTGVIDVGDPLYGKAAVSGTGEAPPQPASTGAFAPNAVPTTTKRCKKRHRTAATAKKRCRKRR